MLQDSVEAQKQAQLEIEKELSSREKEKARRVPGTPKIQPKSIGKLCLRAIMREGPSLTPEKRSFF